MSRNRIIYQSEALYVSDNIFSTEEVNHNQLHRIQNANYGFDIPRQDINQFGQLSRIDAPVVESPTVFFDFSYYITDGLNEKNMGFYVQTINTPEVNFLSGHVTNNDGRNFFVATTAEGIDINHENSLSGKNIIAIGNSIITSYKLDAKVGDFPIVNITTEALNINSSSYTNYKTGISLSGVGCPTPQIDIKNNISLSQSGDIYKIVKLPNPIVNTGQNILNALRPSDIILYFDDFGTSSSGFKSISNTFGTENSLSNDAINIQSFSLNVELTRTAALQLGSKYAYVKNINIPIVASLNINALVNENQLRNFTSSIDDHSPRSMIIAIKNPNDRNQNALKFKLKGFYLKNESFSSSIGENKNVNLSFESQIGSYNDINNGIFICGPSQNNINYFNETNNNIWYNTSNWSLNTIPDNSSCVIMCGNPAYVDLDNPNWKQPYIIDTRNIAGLIGICLYSQNNAIFSGIICGNSSLYGNARFL